MDRSDPETVSLSLVRDSLNVRGGTITLTIAGSCMSPLIRAGDRVTIRSVSFAELTPGDIIAFQDRNLLYAHRLTGKDPRTQNLHTQADRSWQTDIAFSFSQVLGKVTAVSKQGRTLHLDRFPGRQINRAYGACRRLLQAITLPARAAHEALRRRQGTEERQALFAVVSVASRGFLETPFPLPERIDEPLFGEQARAQTLAPWCFCVLRDRQRDHDVFSPTLRETLRLEYYETFSLNAQSLPGTQELFAHLRAQEIGFLVFKGLVLAQGVYADIGARRLGDTDILIRREDLSRLDRVLRERGFRCPVPLTAVPEAPNAYRNALLYLPPDGSLQRPLHVYWHWVNLAAFSRRLPGSIRMERIWQDRIKVDIAGICLETFSWEHHLIYLSMHALAHSYFPLSTLIDIAGLLTKRRKDLEWNGILKDAQTFGLERPLLLALTLAREICSAPVPAAALSRLRPTRLSLFERRFIADAQRLRLKTGKEWLLYLGMNDTPLERLDFILRALFPPAHLLALIRQQPRAALAASYGKRLVAAMRSAS